MKFFYVLLKTAEAYIHQKLGVFHVAKRYVFLYQTISAIKAKRIMEIGTWKGGRAGEMIREAAKASPGESIEYYGFDLFQTLDDETFVREISKQPLSLEQVKSDLQKTGARINLYAGDTTEVLPPLVTMLPKMDFVFIDGGHNEETILSDWMMTQQLMHDDTVVVFDDYWSNRKDGAKPIVDAIDTKIYKVELVPTIDVFFNPRFGRLVIQFAKVTKKAR